jgi:hypothetical protein
MSDTEAVDAARRMLASGEPVFRGTELADNLAGIDAADAEIADLDERAGVLEAEFERRGGWSRAFLVYGDDGHVHSSMHCSTCNRAGKATRFAWMTDYSGADEADIVADAGWRACTVCYPSAPVGDERTLPTRMFTRDEQDKAADRAAREQKRASARAKAVAAGLTPDGSPLQVAWVERDAPGWDLDPAAGRRVHRYRDRDRTKSFKTERAAVTWYVDTKVWRGGAGDEAPALEAIEQAIAAKRGVDVQVVRAELDAKVAAKVRRDR